MSDAQYLRKAVLVVFKGEKGLDLSDMEFSFSTSQQDVESPNNCTIRVYNLKRETVQRVQGEFTEVVLQGGYGKNYGVIFQGTIKQFRIGKESSKDSYLDILAADGDIAYNWAVVNKTLASKSTPADRIKVVMDAMGAHGVGPGYMAPITGGVLPRGKVLFGMGRSVLRDETTSAGYSWDITNGKVNILPMNGYLPGTAVVLTAQTGLIGIPEQTNDGIRVRCLLNPRIAVGGRVQIDNKSINQTIQANATAPPVAFNTYAGIQFLADVTADGFYRVYVAEHSGETRGQKWYTDLICLRINVDTKKVIAP
jgi:hypothetical protein